MPPSQILAVTLRFLATGESYASLEYQFRISKSLLSNMIPYTCELIFSLLKDEYMPCPRAEWEWEEISQQFEESWQLRVQTVLVQEMANTSESSAHRIVAHDTSITKATLALYLWHLWVQDINFFLLMQDAREVQVTEGYLGPRNCGRP